MPLLHRQLGPLSHQDGHVFDQHLLELHMSPCSFGLMMVDPGSPSGQRDLVSCHTLELSRPIGKVLHHFDHLVVHLIFAHFILEIEMEMAIFCPMIHQAEHHQACRLDLCRMDHLGSAAFFATKLSFPMQRRSRNT